MRWQILAGSMFFLVLGCSVESGGEQAPVYEGSGVLIADDADGRTISINGDIVPIVSSCTAGQLLVRTETGWECKFSDSSLEADPSVNSLGKATLSCASGDVAQHDGTGWSCVPRLTEAEVDAWVANNGYADAATVTSYGDRIADLEALTLTLDADLTALQATVASLQITVDALFPTYFVETFSTGSAPGTPVIPASSQWRGPNDTSVSPNFRVSGGYLDRNSGPAGPECIFANQTQVVPLSGAIAPRLRFAALLKTQSSSTNRLTIAYNQDGMAGVCTEGGIGLGVDLQGSMTDTIRYPGTAGAWSSSVLPSDFAINTEYFFEVILSGSTLAYKICSVNYCGEAGAVAFSTGSYQPVMAMGFGSRVFVMVDDSSGDRIRVSEILVETPKP